MFNLQFLPSVSSYKSAIDTLPSFAVFLSRDLKFRLRVQALITRFNYREKGMEVWLIKPAIDTRDDTDGKTVIRSRVGLEASADAIASDVDIAKLFHDGHHDGYSVIIADEAQFFTEKQIAQLRDIVTFDGIPVLCFGLRTDFQAHLFSGSRALLELADSISEIKSICRCGSKAIINARFDGDGNLVTEGEQIFLGGNDFYEGMCYSCWKKLQMNGAALSDPADS